MVLSTITGTLKVLITFSSKTTSINDYIMSIINSGPAQDIYKSAKFHRLERLGQKHHYFLVFHTFQSYQIG